MLRLWLLGLLAVLLVRADADVNHETFQPSSEFVDKQKGIIDLLYHPSQPEIATPDLYNKARNFELNKNQEFQELADVDSLYFKNKSRLQRNQIFSIYHPEHLEETKALYQLFINATSFTKFYNVATWAKTYENEGKFIFALYNAVLNRPDTRHIKLPPLYEVYPNLYFNAEVLKAAIDYKITHRTPGYISFKHRTDRVGSFEPTVIEARYSGWNVDHQTNLLNKLNYFVEDIGLNQYYTYLTFNNPFWLNGNQEKVQHTQTEESTQTIVTPITTGSVQTNRGEVYLHTHKQLLNRYNLERLSNGLPFVEDFAWTKPFPIGYEPNLVYHNGLPVPRRQSLAPYPASAYQNIRDIINFEARITAAIDTGNVLYNSKNHLLSSQNKWRNINRPDGVNILGNLIQGNEDSINKKFYGSVDVLAKKILGYNADAVNKHSVVPSVLQTTAPLKDPAFFSIYNRIVGLYEKYKRNQEPYQVEDVVFKTLKIKSVAIDDLVTYFDSFETTINNGLPINNPNEDRAQLINVRQWRLNHDRFTYNITVNSAVQQRAFVKVFLGPKYDATNKLVQLPQGYSRFFELDTWVASLNEGENVISRSSDEARFTIPDYVSTNTFLENLNTDSQLLKKAAGFPQRLLLPKGTAEGQHFQLFVYIKPLPQSLYFVSSVFGDAEFDYTPLGFPLDKPIDQLSISQDNFRLVDVTIKHKINLLQRESGD